MDDNQEIQTFVYRFSIILDGSQMLDGKDLDLGHFQVEARTNKQAIRIAKAKAIKRHPHTLGIRLECGSISVLLDDN